MSDKKQTKNANSKKGDSGAQSANKAKPVAVPDQRREHWKEEPDPHDYPAAVDYLSLLMPLTEAQSIVERLRNATLAHRKAKDLLRASRLELLGPENEHVAKDLHKVNAGEKLSPVLLVRGRVNADVALTIADGYHRVCASHTLDEDADIPCHIVDLGL